MAHIPLITLSSDFQVQSQGVGAMEAAAFSIAPHAKIVHLMHGLPEFDIISAARTMETLCCIPVGYHVCVCDPGVGTCRRAIGIETARGDYLCGPDNGTFIPATSVLGGIRRVHELSNARYMRQPVSPIFHGRDIFTPAAAHLACGAPLEDFGPAVPTQELAPAPYAEAVIGAGRVTATVIHLNRFGSVHLNIRAEQFDALELPLGSEVALRTARGGSARLVVANTFGDVPPGHDVVMKDDYGRVEIAKNLGSFVGEVPLAVGDALELEFP